MSDFRCPHCHSPIIEPLPALVELADALATHKNVRLWRLGHLAAGRGAFFVVLKSGKRHCQTNTYDRVLQWFSDHWPEGLDWPPDIPRPEPRPEGERGEAA